MRFQHAKCAPHIGGPDSGTKAKTRVVGDGQRFLLVFKLDDGQDGAKDFFLGNPHIIFNIGKNSRFDEPSIPACRLGGRTTTRQ